MIKRSLQLSLLLVLFSTPIINAQDVKVEFTGPTKVEAKELAVIKINITGAQSIDKLKYAFQCLPKNTDWYPVKFLDGSVGIMFSTKTQAVYHFFGAFTDEKGNLITASWELTVGEGVPKPPNPPDPPPDTRPVDSLTKVFNDAYALDLAAGVGSTTQKNQLSLLFKNASTITVNDKTLTKPQQIWDVMHNAAVKAIGDGALPNLRKALAARQKEMLKINASTVLSDDIRAQIGAVLLQISQSLDRLPLPSTSKPSI